MKLRILAEAEAETQSVGQWYEDRREGLGGEFFEALGDGLSAVERTPLRFPKTETGTPRDIRRLRLSRFPYHLIYEIRPTELLLLAVAHSHRGPKYWERRGGNTGV